MKLRSEFIIMVLVVCCLAISAYYEVPPIREMMDWKARKNATSKQEVNQADYQIYEFSKGMSPEITIDFLKGPHFWNPQVAVWIEDTSGHYMETLMVTTSTAQGLFYSGRTSENFREVDEVKQSNSSPTRRVDALPYWSHKRGVKYADGYFSPPGDQPLPDGITGATPTENFHLTSDGETLTSLQVFKVLVEVNVAFDENEYFSEYEFLEDSLYHGGTGLLGQPSLIYSATFSKYDSERYKVMKPIGHGHHSGGSGELFFDLSTLTTARYVAERIVVGVSEEWFIQGLP